MENDRPTIIIQKFKEREGTSDLKQAFLSEGYAVKEVGVNASLQLDDDIIDTLKNNPTIAFGSILFVNNCLNISDTVGPIAWYSPENYAFSHYAPPLQEFLFNDDFALFPAGCLPALKFNIYSKFGKDCMIFMRPDSGEKLFGSGLYGLQYFDKDVNSFLDKVSLEELVVVSTPKNIRGEWRFICNDDGEIITQSTYRYQGKITLIPSAPEGARKVCEKIQEKMLTCGCFPDKLFTVDVVEDNDGAFWLMELNSFNMAGLYACDVLKIVKEITKPKYLKQNTL